MIALLLIYRSGFASIAPQSALALHREGRTKININIVEFDLSQKFLLHKNEHYLLKNLKNYNVHLKDCCKQMYSTLSADVEHIQNKSLTDQTFWLKVRQFRITGSRCYNIYTYNQNPKTTEEWAVKSSDYFWPKLFTSKFTLHGITYENTAREMYIKNTSNKVVKSGFIINKNEKWLGYSPDGVIVDSNNYPTKLLEIKCPFQGSNTDINELMEKLNYVIKNNNGTHQLKKKHAYYGQVQLGMIMLNVSICDFVIYSSHSNEYKVIEILFDRDFAETMVISLKNAYFTKMLHNICILKEKQIIN